MVLDVESPLSELADWITNDNELFDRNMANRIWYQYLASASSISLTTSAIPIHRAIPSCLNFLLRSFEAVATRCGF